MLLLCKRHLVFCLTFPGRRGKPSTSREQPIMATVSSLTFGTLLKRYRLAAGLTQEELADRAGHR